MLSVLSREASLIPFFATALLVSSSALAASPPWAEPFTADTQSIVASSTALKEEPYGISILLREEEFDFDESGVETQRTRWIFRINDEDGAKEYAAFQTTWAPGLQASPTFRVRVIQPSGKVETLDPATAVDVAPSADDDDIFHERKSVRAPLPNVHVGSVIEQEVVYRHLPSLFQKGTVHRVELGGPILLARLIIHAPASLPLKLTPSSTKEPAPKIVRDGAAQSVVAEWRELPDLPPAETMLPLALQSRPAIYVSTGASWKVLAQAYSEIVDGKVRGFSSPPEAKAAAAKAKTPVEKARALTRWLREKVRYTGLYFGEGTVLPTSPSETLQRGFGDCKDMSTALVALLRAEGVSAHVALLNVGGYDLEEQAPGLGELDHAIVYVSGPKPFAVDPTLENYPAGTPVAHLAGRALMVANASLSNPVVRLPEASSADHGYELTRDVSLAELNNGGYATEISYRGAFIEQTGWLELSSKPDDLKTGVERLAKGQFGCEAVSDYAVTSGDTQLRLKLRGAECSKIVTDDNDAIAVLQTSGPLGSCPDLLLGSKDRDGAALPKREQPFRWPVPFTAKSTFRIPAPFGFRPRVAPEKREWKLGGARFTREVTVAPDGVVTVQTFFDSGPRVQSAADVEAFRAEYDRSWQELSEYHVKFEHIAPAEIAAGHVVQGLAAYRAAMRAHPKEALHRIQYASTLLQLGFAAEARKQGAMAVKLDPKWGSGFRVYGWILQFDELGRRFLSGWDRAGSIAALREAVKLEEESAAARRLLAQSLLRDEQGRAFPADGLDEAVTVLKEARKISKKDDEDVALLAALYRAGKFHDCAVEAEQFGDYAPAKEMHIACLGAEKGPAAAIAQLEKEFPAAQRAQQALTVAADAILMRKYELARALRERFPSDSTDEGRVMQDRLLADLKRIDSPKFVDDPAAVVSQLLYWTTSGGDQGPPAALFSSGLTNGQPMDGAASSGIRQELEGQLLPVEQQGVPRSVMKDMILSCVKFSTQKELKHGSAKVDAHVLTGDALTAYMVKEKSGWALRGLGSQRAELAAEADTRLKKGDLEGARLWLRWALAERSSGSELIETERARAAAWPELEKADAQALRVLAATFLVAARAHRAEGLQIIDAAKSLEPAAQLAVDWAVGDALANSRDPEEAKRTLEIAARLAKVQPSSVAPIGMRVWALGHIGDMKAFGAEVDALAAQYANDGEVLWNLARASGWFADRVRQRRLIEQMISKGFAHGRAFNELAWLELFDGRSGLKAAEEHAVKANELLRGNDGATLNTLAAVQAELGRGKTAFQLVIASLRSRGRAIAEPHRADWYVMGRIAEGYGLDDVSRALYERARLKDEDALNDDVTEFVQRRLSKLPPAAVGTDVP